MSNRSLIVLVLLGVISLGAGWYFGPGRTPAAMQAAKGGSLAFPGLADRLMQARRIEIVHQGKTVTVERHGEGANAAWGLAERGDYPVETSVLRGMLTGLTELRLVEPRTSDPTKFARLGVEDPDTPDGTSNLLRLLDADGKPLAAIVLGHRRVRTQGNVPESIYVRRPDQAQSWLAEGRLEVSADPQTLIDRDILSIAPARIVSVTVTRGTERLELIRDGDKLVPHGPAEHPPLDADKLEGVSRALDSLTLLDVRRSGGPPPPAAVGEAVFTAIDGLEVRVTLFKDGKALWARFVVSGPEAIRSDVHTLAAKLTGWEFQISPWKEKMLVPTLDDLKADPIREAPPANAPGGKP